MISVIARSLVFWSEFAGNGIGGSSCNRGRILLSFFVSLLCHFFALVLFWHFHGRAIYVGNAKPLSIELVISIAEASDVEYAEPSDAKTTDWSLQEQRKRGVVSEWSPEIANAAAEIAASKGRQASRRPAAPVYLTPGELGRRPIPLHPVAPNYPEGIDNVAGKVEIVLFINEAGTMDSVRVQSSNLPAVFEDEAMRAFLGARYSPGLVAGKPVRTRLVVEVLFEADRNSSVTHGK